MTTAAAIRQFEDLGSAAAAAPLPCDGYLVVSKRLASPVPPYKFDYYYNHYADVRDAHADYDDLEAGEYPGREAVAIVTCRQGKPTGERVR